MDTTIFSTKVYLNSKKNVRYYLSITGAFILRMNTFFCFVRTENNKVIQ